MKIGVHVSIGKGFVAAVKSAVELNCDGFQIFAGNPRGWARKPIPAPEYDMFKAQRGRSGLWPVVVHLSYLPNLATDDQQLYEKSVLTLAEDFERANQLGADFLVFHPGKSEDHLAGIERVIPAVDEILSRIQGPTRLLFENQSGAGGEIASSFEELGRLVKGVSFKERIGICFDTCHGFAAGYDVSNPSGWERTLEGFERYIGLGYLRLFHLNDSVGSLGSHLDRHHHIGQGMIGLPGFQFLVTHPVLASLPGILETPQKDQDDDRNNLATLRQLMEGDSFETGGNIH